MIRSIPSFSKVARFADLTASVQHCNLCPRLCSKRKIFADANGDVESRVLFVAEAPGRLGADRTGVPLHGDRTGDNFESLLGNVGWKRHQVFITNAILCNPQDADGTNGTPTTDEIENCSAYLEMAIALVQPEVVVSLGATALNALSVIAPHGFTLREDVARLVPWGGVRLFPLYHPGPRAAVHRSLAKQRSDFMMLAKVVHPVRGIIAASTSGRSPARTLARPTSELTHLQVAAKAFLELGRRMTYFKLTKLLYLTDLAALENAGRMVTAGVYLRQVDGPWLPDLDDALRQMDGHEVHRFFSRRIPMVELGPSPRSQGEVVLDDEALRLICDVFERYGRMDNAQIKTAVYRTAPMQYILRAERAGGDMRNRPVLYRDRRIDEADESAPLGATTDRP